MTHKEFIDFYQGYMKGIDCLLQTKPLEYWIMLFLLSSKSRRISWWADIDPVWISDIGPFLGYRFHPCPLEQITSASFAAIRKRLEFVPLTADNIPKIAHSRFIIYGFDCDNRMVCAFDSHNNMYSFEYSKNKVRIVQTFIPHPPREVEDPIGQAFEKMYQEIHKGPELIEIAECEYDEIPWSKVFLFNRSFTTFSGKTQSRALLFPMESVYESYIAGQVKKVFQPEDWMVSSQHRGHYLFEEPRRQFSLRPDIVINKGDRTVIMDTKWKSLIPDEYKNYGISQSDMYQMYAYSKKYRTPEIWLLYPINHEMRGHKDIRFDSGDGTMVNVFFVDIEKISDSMEQLRTRIDN